MMFDRIALVNLDSRLDRLGAFKAKIADIPSLGDYVRYRAVHGDSVTVPHFFTSGGGAWGCRQSHLRLLEDALMDGVNSLLVLEDDVCFCPNFQDRLIAFMRAVPDDWQGLMFGGQNQAEPTETPVGGVKRATDTQRTHAYAVRGKEPMQALYRLWARSDRHIDHLFGHWQQDHIVYQPDPFLCGQDQGKSDITGRDDSTRFWFSSPVPANTPLYVLTCPRMIAEQVRLLGFHFGNHREPITGFDKGLKLVERSGWPPEQLQKWADLIQSEAAASEQVPGMWHDPLPDKDTLETRLKRPIVQITAETVEQVTLAIPALYPRYVASQIIWCWHGQGVEQMYGLEYYGWHAGYHRDPVTGLNNHVRKMVDTPLTDDRKAVLGAVVRQLTVEITKVRYGKILLAHPELDVTFVRDNLGVADVRELHGTTVKDILASYDSTMRVVLRY